MKKVFFSCSIAGGRDHAHTYADIVKYIKASGVQVLSEVFADKNLNAEEGTGKKHGLTDTEIRQWDLDWIAQTDAVIAEVTQPSLGVGYEIAKAEDLDKPILALFYEDSGRRLSPMVAGNPNVKTLRYKKVEDLEKPISDFIDSI